MIYIEIAIELLKPEVLSSLLLPSPFSFAHKDEIGNEALGMYFGETKATADYFANLTN
jgi:hypothetical protein